MKQLTRCLFIALLAASLAACNGDDGGFTPSSTGGGGDGGAAAPAGNSSVQLGSGSGDQFQAGTLTVATSKLSAGGTTTVTATLVKNDGTPYTGDATVTFVSNCAQEGTAELDSPVDAKNGAAVSTYVAKGCSGTDTVTATATVEGTDLIANGVVTVAPADLGEIVFISADPDTISYRGSEMTEISNVTFEVHDANGNPLAGQKVNFSLTTTVGGISFSNDETTASAKSGADGQVSVAVHAGTFHTAVWVVATVEDTAISTLSNVLTISSGIPDADSFSLAAESFNPEAYDYNNVKDKITVNLADRFNNSVPDGTPVTFLTDYGKVDGQCTTKDSVCSVEWTSQNPRPANGRVHILAYAIGEESFKDTNGNGIFDSSDTFTDTGEPFVDENENGSYDAGELTFYDFSSDNVRNGPDGHYEGLLCRKNCGPDGITPEPGEFVNSTTGIGGQIVLVMSGSHAIICNSQPTGIPAVCPGTTTASFGNPLSLYITDERGQVMPSGTTITIKGSNVGLTGDTSLTVPSTTTPQGPYKIGIGSTAPGTGPSSITVTVKTPTGVTSQAVFTVT